MRSKHHRRRIIKRRGYRTSVEMAWDEYLTVINGQLISESIEADKKRKKYIGVI